MNWDKAHYVHRQGHPWTVKRVHLLYACSDIWNIFNTVVSQVLYACSLYFNMPNEHYFLNCNYFAYLFAIEPPYIIYANQPRKPALNALLYNLHIKSWSRPWSPPRTGPAGHLKSLYEQSLPLPTGCRPDVVHVPQGAVRPLSSDTALRSQVNVPFGT